MIPTVQNKRIGQTRSAPSGGQCLFSFGICIWPVTPFGRGFLQADRLTGREQVRRNDVTSQLRRSFKRDLDTLMASSQEDEASLLPTSRRMWLQQELDALHDAFRNEPPLCTIPASPLSLEKTDPRHTRRLVGQYVEGQRLPLTNLTDVLTTALEVGDDLKVVICDVATRKFYGPKAGKEEVDLAPFDDVSRGPFWFWELRSVTLLPEGLRMKASTSRQKHKQMQERMLALSAVIRLCENEEGQKTKWTQAMQTRARKAVEKLERVPDLTTINERFVDSREEESIKRVGKRVKRETTDDQELTASKELKKQERIASASGFGSIKSLKNAQRMFKDFFCTPQKEMDCQVAQGFTMGGRCVLTCPENKRSLEGHVSQKTLGWICRLFFECGHVERMDAGLDAKPDEAQIQQEFLQNCQRIRSLSSRDSSVIYGDSLHRTSLQTVIQFIGAPATWARRPNYSLNVEAECERLFGAEWQSLDVHPVRMKYLWFHSDSDCPPYFGPFAGVQDLHPRNPFLQAPGLDYDELFDEGWEEVPDGESLSVDEDEDEDKTFLSDEDDAFVVEDGYLSEDEGLGADMELDDTCSVSSNAAAETETENNQGDSADVAQVEARTRQCLKSGKPLVVTRLPISLPVKKSWVKGEPSLLHALNAIPLTKERLTLSKKP